MGVAGRLLGGPVGDYIEDKIFGDTASKKRKRRSRDKWLKPPCPMPSPLPMPIEDLLSDTDDKLVKPVPGSVLKCDLVLGAASHTGIYLGNDQIAEVTEINGRARVRVVSPDEFIDGDPGSIVRTGLYVYVATSNGKALGSKEIARRARASLNRSRGKYSLAGNNCHMFTRYCITGVDSDESVLSEDEIADVLCEIFGVDSVEWSSTGLGCGDNSFDDVDYGEVDDTEEDEDGGHVVLGDVSDIIDAALTRVSKKSTSRQGSGGKRSMAKKTAVTTDKAIKRIVKAAVASCVVYKPKTAKERCVPKVAPARYTSKAIKKRHSR